MLTTSKGTFKTTADAEQGTIYLYGYTKDKASSLRPLTLQDFPNGQTFHPLGIEWDPHSKTLYVVNHGLVPPVLEIFTVDIASATATHVRTFAHKLLPAPNSVHSMGEGKLYVTNDHYFTASMSKVLAQMETFGGYPGGTVVYVDLGESGSEDEVIGEKKEMVKGDGVEAKVIQVARVPFANGVTQLNSTTLAVASSSKAGIFFYTILPDHTLQQENFVRTPASVDNLSVDSQGKLLMAGHPFAPTLMKVAKGRAKCVMGSEVEEERAACQCNADSWVAEWSEEGGLKELVKGDQLCSSSTVVRDVGRGVGIVSGLYDHGITVFKV